LTIAPAHADGFARATAKQAHTNSTQALELARTALKLAHDTNERAVIRPRLFVGLCSLCGEPCKHTARYCSSHEWAA
jgi:hypothetical protein